MNSIQTAFKVLTAEEWSTFEKDGAFSGTALDRRDGYIHLSTFDQLRGTLERHFCGQEGLVIVEIDLGLLGATVRWEEAREGELFPHLYGQLARHHVIGIKAGR